MNISYVGEGKVYLIAGGGRTYTDMAASFCRTEKELEEIIASPENKKLLQMILSSNHKAALEFDDYLFGISGYSRVTEAQLIRKRHASYMIKSGRVDKHGKRSYDVVLPKNISAVEADCRIRPEKVTLQFIKETDPEIINVGLHDYLTDIDEYIPKDSKYYRTTLGDAVITLDSIDLLYMLEDWYAQGVEDGIPEEDLRYLKPQATEFKAMVKMNAAALKDYFAVRLCNRAQLEHRDLANKMYIACTRAHPEIFKDFGPNCKLLGYCPEEHQCEQKKGFVPTKKEALELLNKYYMEGYYNDIS